MAIAIILGIVLLVLAVVAGILAGYFFGDDRSGSGIASVIACVVLSLAFLAVPFSIRTIDAGEIAVVKEMGKIIDTREAGTHFDFWMTRSYTKYDTKVRGVEVTTAAYSHDKQPMEIQMTVQYQVKKDKVKDIAINYGGLEALESKLSSIAIERTKSCLSKYDADSIIETRGTISAEVADVVENAIGEQYFVDVTNVALTNIDFSDAYEQSVEQSMIAKQEVEKAKAEAEKAIAAANGELEVAKLQAQAKIEAAKADAEAQRLVAQAAADSVRLKSLEVARMLGFDVIEDTEASYKEWRVKTNPDGSSVVDEDGKVVYEEVYVKIYKIDFTGKDSKEIAVIKEYLKYIEYLNKWDGKLPTVMTDNGAILQIPTDSVESTNK